MPRRTLGVVVVVLGLTLLAVSFLADRIGLGGMPAVFGWKQILGAGVGLVLAVVGGVMLARRGAPQG